MQFRCTSVWCDRDIRGEMESRKMDRPDSDLTGSEPVILKREERESDGSIEERCFWHRFAISVVDAEFVYRVIKY